MNSSRENIFNGKTSNDHRTLSENVMYADGFLWQLLFAVIMYALKMSQPNLSAWAESNSKTFLKSQPLQNQSSLKPSLCSLEVFFESLFEILCGSSWKFPFKFSLCFVTWPCCFGLSAKLSVSSLPISFVSFLSKLCLSSCRIFPWVLCEFSWSSLSNSEDFVCFLCCFYMSSLGSLEVMLEITLKLFSDSSRIFCSIPVNSLWVLVSLSWKPLWVCFEVFSDILVAFSIGIF